VIYKYQCLECKQNITERSRGGMPGVMKIPPSYCRACTRAITSKEWSEGTMSGLVDDSKPNGGLPDSLPLALAEAREKAARYRALAIDATANAAKWDGIAAALLEVLELSHKPAAEVIDGKLSRPEPEAARPQVQRKPRGFWPATVKKAITQWQDDHKESARGPTKNELAQQILGSYPSTSRQSVDNAISLAINDGSILYKAPDHLYLPVPVE